MVDPRFVEVYEKHSTDLVGYATALVGPVDAWDVVSEAMLRVFSSGRFEHVREPRAYLFRTVHNEAARRTKRSALSAAKELLAPKPAPPDLQPNLDHLGVFAVLSVRERAVIYLTYWQDLPILEVADYLGINDGTVRRYLARARTKLRKELDHA